MVVVCVLLWFWYWQSAGGRSDANPQILNRKEAVEWMSKPALSSLSLTFHTFMASLSCLFFLKLCKENKSPSLPPSSYHPSPTHLPRPATISHSSIFFFLLPFSYYTFYIYIYTLYPHPPTTLNLIYLTKIALPSTLWARYLFVPHTAYANIRHSLAIGCLPDNVPFPLTFSTDDKATATTTRTTFQPRVNLGTAIQFVKDTGVWWWDDQSREIGHIGLGKPEGAISIDPGQGLKKGLQQDTLLAGLPVEFHEKDFVVLLTCM